MEPSEHLFGCTLVGNIEETEMSKTELLSPKISKAIDKDKPMCKCNVAGARSKKCTEFYGNIVGHLTLLWTGNRAGQVVWRKGQGSCLEERIQSLAAMGTGVWLQMGI